MLKSNNLQLQQKCNLVTYHNSWVISIYDKPILNDIKEVISLNFPISKIISNIEYSIKSNPVDCRNNIRNKITYTGHKTG